MRICEYLRCGLALAALACAVSPALALDPRPQTPVAPPLPLAAFKSTRDAVSSGVKDYNAGHKAAAVRALEFAAQQGHALARWKLGKMYADGDGVPHDDLKAFEYFSKICDNQADEGSDPADARSLSSTTARACLAIGSYLLVGIPNSYVKRDLPRARETFQYAASYFGDPDAQYNLARMHLDGQGGPKDPRQAMRWLNLAAEKGHVASQALLGHLLFSGEGGARQRARGLMWLTLARDAADPAKDAWISDLYAQAFSTAADTDRQAALVFLEQQIRKRP
jgi:TPR repeat protein